MSEKEWIIVNPGGSRRVIVTKDLPGEHWKQILEAADCSIEICTDPAVLSNEEIIARIGDRCDGAIGQLTEDWSAGVFAALRAAGGKAYSNGAVGYNNVDVAAATANGIPVGNTPGVLTETTAEMAVALTFAAGRRVTEGDRFMRGGHYQGWLPTMLLGQRFVGKTVGVVGAGRIGSAYARMMAEGHKMHLVYHDLYPNLALESYIADYSAFLVDHGEAPLTCRRLDSVLDVLREADVVSLHTVLDDSTRHLIDAAALAVMKPDAVLVNSSRGPVIDEVALVEHCRTHPEFRVGLDVFEDEPAMKPGLAELDNVVIVPHIASATVWTREGMSSLAAANVAAILAGYPVWESDDITPFLSGEVPKAAPSIVNAADLEESRISW